MLHYHLYADHQVGDAVCDVCGTILRNIHYVKRHIDHVHRRIKNYQCDKCDARYQFKGKLLYWANHKIQWLKFRESFFKIFDHFSRSDFDQNPNFSVKQFFFWKQKPQFWPPGMLNSWFSSNPVNWRCKFFNCTLSKWYKLDFWPKFKDWNFQFLTNLKWPNVNFSEFWTS